ncbi:MAG: hypothetical protein ACQEQV_07380 [Fibrobacterota bacterium]
MTKVNFVDYQIKKDVESMVDRLRKAVVECDEVIGISRNFIKNGLDAIRITSKASAGDGEKIKNDILKVIKERTKSVRERLDKFKNLEETSEKLIGQMDQKKFNSKRDTLRRELKHLQDRFPEIEKCIDDIKDAGKDKILETRKKLQHIERHKVYLKMKNKYTK